MYPSTKENIQIVLGFKRLPISLPLPDHKFFIKIDIRLVLNVERHVGQAFVPLRIVGVVLVEYSNLTARLLLHHFPQSLLVFGHVLRINLFVHLDQI